MAHWDWIWAALIVAGLLYFAVFETIALATHRPDRTFSQRIRAWLGISPPKRHRRVAAALFAAGLTILTIWFVPHIVFGL